MPLTRHTKGMKIGLTPNLAALGSPPLQHSWRGGGKARSAAVGGEASVCWLMPDR